MGRARSCRLRRWTLAAVVGPLAALATSPSAAAHARLLATEPANDAVLRTGPSEIRLRFSEPVEAAFGAVRVYDGTAQQVDAGEVERPRENEVTMGVADRLARGTYTVTWHVVSADGHPISGAFVFHVGAPGANPAGVAADVADEGAPRSVSIAFAFVRAVEFALILLLAGGTAMFAIALREAPEQARSLIAATLSSASLLLALVAQLALVVQGASAGGFGLRDAATWDVVSTVAGTRFGELRVAEIAVACVCACVLWLAARRGPDSVTPAAAAGFACLLVLVPSSSGHASVSGGVAFVADAAHVAAGAVWVGGLAALVLALVVSGSGRWALAERAVPRFSALAVCAVALLVLAGSVNGYLQVRALRGLWDTTYGRVLLVKLALVLPLLALGAYNNRFFVPRLRAGIGSAAERTRFLRTAGAELALMAAVVGVTAVLVAEPPARAQVAPIGPYATTANLGGLELGLVVDPAAAGPNSIQLYLTNRSGQPTDVAEATVQASLASRGIGPLRLDARRAGPGHFAIRGAPLTLPGDWQLRVQVRRGEFDAFATTVSVPIREER